MNIAFPAVIILLLTLPGILFIYSYRRGFWRTPVSLGPVQDELGKGIIAALIINVIVANGIEAVSDWTIDYQALAMVLSGWSGVDERAYSAHIEVLAGYPNQVVAYFMVVTLLGTVGGFALHKTVRWLKFDLMFDHFRFNNEWYYLFQGESRVFDVPQKQRTRSTIIELMSHEIGFVFISAAVEQAGATYLYWGVLSEYYFTKAGELDRLVLREVQQVVDPVDNEQFYPLRGDYLVLRYADIKNLNIDYKMVSDRPASTRA
ncbi:MAG: hypothetical protein WD049_00270 [Candidatus Paceibacterota bacterium]